MICAQKFPDATFFFTPANMTNQILDFGLPAPIDLQVIGHDPGNYELATKLAAGRLRRFRERWMCTCISRWTIRRCRSNADRTKARQVGLTQSDVAKSTLISLSGSGQTAPNYWLNPADAGELPDCDADAELPDLQLCRRWRGRRLRRRTGTRRSCWGMWRIFGGTCRRSSRTTTTFSRCMTSMRMWTSEIWAGWRSEIEKIMDQTKKGLPKTTQLELRGEVQTMNDSFTAAGRRNYFRDHAGVSADGGELPVVAGSADYSDGDSVRVLRDSVDAVSDADDVQRAVV